MPVSIPNHTQNQLSPQVQNQYYYKPLQQPINNQLNQEDNLNQNLHHQYQNANSNLAYFQEVNFQHNLHTQQHVLENQSQNRNSNLISHHHVPLQNQKMSQDSDTDINQPTSTVNHQDRGNINTACSTNITNSFSNSNNTQTDRDKDANITNKGQVLKRESGRVTSSSNKSIEPNSSSNTPLLQEHQNKNNTNNTNYNENLLLRQSFRQNNSDYNKDHSAVNEQGNVHNLSELHHSNFEVLGEQNGNINDSATTNNGNNGTAGQQKNHQNILIQQQNPPSQRPSQKNNTPIYQKPPTPPTLPCQPSKNFNNTYNSVPNMKKSMLVCCQIISIIICFVSWMAALFSYMMPDWQMAEVAEDKIMIGLWQIHYVMGGSDM